MKRTLKLALRTLYILPAIGVLFGGDVIKHKIAPGAEGIGGPKEAEADAPYAQSYYQGYYEGYYESYYQASYWDPGPPPGDCPDGPGPDSPDGGCC